MFRLNARAVAALCKTNQPGRYADGAGLYLQIKNGGQSWVFRYRRRTGTNSQGKRHALREMGLGPVGSVSLSEARQKAAAAFAKLTTGATDPLAEREARRHKADGEKTFGVFVEKEFLQSATNSFKNDKHKAQWGATLRTYAKPIWSMALPAIQPVHIRLCLDPIWAEKPETARRLRGRIERVLSAAKVLGYRDGENPARWRDNLKEVYGTQVQSKKHHAAVPYADMPAFMRDLRKLNSASASALEFTILTAARTGEVRGARWGEINGNVWTIPPDRMKAKRQHRVVLSDAALAVLAKLKRGKPDDLIFEVARDRRTRGQPLSDQAMLQCVRGIREGATTHGFRSSFKDWCREKTNYPDWLSEIAMAHTIRDKTVAAYARGDALEARGPLMTDWAAFLSG
ncbi:MAG: integrase arm-type DNA-binding domain-containing protein [Pseudolabrys sp.]|nr:integrase arm-type DNA-binding domain-containing protein [Pseudolabrys sp.]